MGFEIHHPDEFVKKTRDTMAAAADSLHHAAGKLGDASMPKNTLGMLGELSHVSDEDLTEKYNKARDAAVDKLWSDIKAIVDSIHSVEDSIHVYNGADKAAMERIIFAGANPLDGHHADSDVERPQQNQTGGHAKLAEKPKQGAR